MAAAMNSALPGTYTGLNAANTTNEIAVDGPEI
jgi:hypothetical protein